MRAAYTQVFHAYGDESGDRGMGPKSSRHFVMAAALVTHADLGATAGLLAQLRTDLHRPPGTPLSWKKIDGHPRRLHVASTLGAAPWLTVTAVVVCKRHLGGLPPDLSYMYTFRYLLERMSWFARDRLGVIDCTLAHIKRFRLSTLRGYEHSLQNMGTEIHWPSVPAPTQIDQPSRLEQLQLGDLCASAVAQAFSPDEYGNTETRYLERLAPRLYRRPPGALTSYGLKMHPWNATTKPLYPWIEAL